jgi:hypothetical protein
MAAPTLTAATVMDKSAVYLNDPSKTRYTYEKQIPFLNGALQELQEFFELNEVPVTATVSAVIQVDAGVDYIGFSNTDPKLPDDLIEPSVLWERTRDIDPYVPMTAVDVLPRYMEGIEISQFIYYVWQTQRIKFFASNADNDIKMDYIRNLFTPVTKSADSIFIINAQSFLEFRNAGLCARFLGENPSRADSLDNDASLSLDRALGISTKGRQNITTRHRPFRAGFKRRANV